MGQFHIGGCGGDQEAALVAHGGSTNEATSGDGGVDYGNVGGERGFEEGVKVFGAVDAGEAVGVG